MSSIYVDDAAKRIYIDYSTRATFQSCKDKARLSNVEGWRSKEKGKEDFPLDFGHAFHAAVANYHDWAAGGYFVDGKWNLYDDRPSGTRVAQAAFMADLKTQGSNLPIAIETQESRSLERGVMLVEAYIERWKNEPYENILAADGSPLTEIYFEVEIAQWGDWSIWYCGTIDRIMMNVMTKRPTIFETKTTGKPLSVFIQECKPNHQVSGYFKIAWELMSRNFPDYPAIAEAVWDCVFVSKRQPDTSKGLKNRFWMWGIDAIGDFARQTTSRSKTDIINFGIDLEADAIEFAKWLMSGATHWPKAGGFACHAYGGCAFRGYCSTNDAPEILNTYFEVKPWNPRKRLRELS
jgi:PD-(D/E)XK nuclease superfamily